MLYLVDYSLVLPRNFVFQILAAFEGLFQHSLFLPVLHGKRYLPNTVQPNLSLIDEGGVITGNLFQNDALLAHCNWVGWPNLTTMLALEILSCFQQSILVFFFNCDIRTVLPFTCCQIFRPKHCKLSKFRQ
jgi:hypothetical protein